MAYSTRSSTTTKTRATSARCRKTIVNVGTGLVGAPECGDVMKLQVKVNPATGRHRRREVQDVRLRIGDRELQPGDRMAEGQDGRRGARDQEHRHRQRAEPAAGEDPLLGAGGGRDQGGDRATTRRSRRPKARRPRGGAADGIRRGPGPVPLTCKAGPIVTRRAHLQTRPLRTDHDSD